MGTIHHFVLTAFLISQSTKMLHTRQYIFVKNKAQEFADEPISSDNRYYSRIECSIKCTMHDTCKGFGWANGACVLHYNEFKLSWKQEVYTKVPIYFKIALLLTFFTNISFLHGFLSMAITEFIASHVSNNCKELHGKIINLSPVLRFIYKPVIFLQCTTNDWFLYETQHWAEMG